MSFTTLFLIFISIFILFKTSVIAKRNKLNEGKEKGIFIIACLIIALIITDVMFLYPQWLYWSVFSVLTTVGVVFLSDVIKQEYHRFVKMSFKDQIQNILFYNLLVIITTIYL